MPETPWPISFWLREMRKLQPRVKRMALGPIYAAAAMLVLAVVMMLLVAANTKFLRESPVVPTKPEAQTKLSAQPLQAAPAATPVAGPAHSKSVDSLVPHKPVTGPVKFAFGWQLYPVYNEWRYHAGLDLGAAEGAPVQAVYSGAVTAVYKDRDYGLTVAVASGSTSVYYGSLDAADLAEGQSVAAGGSIGKAGTCTAEPYYHLHLAIKSGGKYIDPEEVLSRAQ